MPNQPIQVVTNPQRLQQPREKQSPKSVGTDFFADRNSAFERHQARLADQIRGVLDVIAASQYLAEYGGLGYVRVRMNSRSIAKSHRPQKSLFRRASTPHVATAGVGEPIFACTPSTLKVVLDKVLGAEVEVPTKVRKDTGEVVPNPSRARCEVSAISSIELWAEPDKRGSSPNAWCNGIAA
ncbi:hypothetical protein [Plantibacter sp. RU18]|uniref:hypothetical protein n=1 Tax=Plantibacter sp. RU18 TaxID=3158143 RepID=UPI003D36BA27